MCEELTQKAVRSHEYAVHPNFWMKAFGITDPREILEINERIKKDVASGQQELAAERAKKGFTVFGAKRLRRQEILAPHTPKKHQRRNFVLSSIKELRIAYIKEVKELFAECSRLYKLACNGHRVSWPPGIFPPAIPPLANAFE